jgi:hypothetical protein
MGYAVVTTVLAPAVSYNLTDLNTVKDELSIDADDTANDSWLGRAIAQLSTSISNYTKRVFAPETVQDVFDVQQDPYPWQTPGGFAQLELSRWPVLAVASVVQTLALNTLQTLVAGTDYRLDPATGLLLRLNPFTGAATTWEAVPVTVVYTAGYGALVQETDSVPASAPYQVTVQQAAAFSCDAQVAYASGALLVRVAASPLQGQYSIAAGVYGFNAADEGQALTFAYATSAIPNDLVDAVLQLITGRFRAKGRDPALIQRDQPGLGTERFWFGGAPGQKGPFPPDITAMLDTYRTPTVA